MYINSRNGINPYTAYASVYRSGLAGSAGGILPPQISQGDLGTLLGNGLKGSALASVGRLDGLSALLAKVSSYLGVLTHPGNAARLTVDTSSPSALAATLTAPSTSGVKAVTLRAASDATYATMLTNPISLSPAGARAATSATMTSGVVALDASSVDVPKTSTTLTTGRIVLDTSQAHGPTAAVMTGGPLSLDTRGASDATGAVLKTGAISLDTSAAVGATAATLQSASVTLDASADVAATRAVVTSGPVTLNTATPSSATLTGGSLGLSATHDTTGTDFGTMTINGHTVLLGLYTGANDVGTAAQYLVDQINGDSAAAVSAALDGSGQHVTLTSKVGGPSGNFMLDSVSTDGLNYGNEGLTGFTTGSSAAGSLGVTDFGSLSVNGVTTVLGTMTNDGQSAQSAAQLLVDRLNANADNGFTASVGGDNSDQLVLTSKTLGSAGNLSVSGAALAGNPNEQGGTGLSVGQSGLGTDTQYGSTDFGSITVNGVTTRLGSLGNAGQTSQSAAQVLVDRLNANSANAFVASLGGAQQDQLVLTATSTGAESYLSVDSAESYDRHGFTPGANATGQANVGGLTDFGAVTVNGVTTQLGVFDNTNQTVQSAAQYLADRLNANSANSFVASVGGDNADQLVLTTQDTGSQMTLNVQAASATGQNGFGVGTSAVGQDAGGGTTDFGSLTINGVTTQLGLFDNTNQTVQSAAQAMADRLNANSANSFIASVGGDNSDQLVLSSRDSGSQSALYVDATSGEQNLFTKGNYITGQDANAGTTDFGSVRLNGVTTALGSFDNAGLTPNTAASMMADELNLTMGGDFVASVGGSNSDQLILTARAPGSSTALSVDAVDGGPFSGFGSADVTAGDDGVAGETNFGSITLNGVKIGLGTLANAGQTSQSAAQYLVDRINANAASPATAAVGGTNSDQIVLTSPLERDGSVLSMSAVSRGGFNGFTAGVTAQGQAESTGVTDFGSVTLGGVQTDLGVLDNAGQNAQSAASYLVDKLNANDANGFVASIAGTNSDQIQLTSKTAGPGGSFKVDALSADSNLDGTDNGVNGFAAGQSATGLGIEGATTDFGAVTINGVTTTFGALANTSYTPSTAAQFLADRLNATNTGIRASVANGTLQIVGRGTGANAAIDVQSVTEDSDGDPGNNASTGLLAGQHAQGRGALPFAGSDGSQGTVVADQAQVSYMVSTAQSFASWVNEYRSALSVESQQGMTQVQSLNSNLDQTLRSVGDWLGAVGLSYQNGQMAVDTTALTQALTQDPGQTMDLFTQAKQALDPELGGHTAMLGLLRSATIDDGTAGAAPAGDLTQADAQVSTALYRSSYLKAVLATTQEAQNAAQEQGISLMAQLQTLNEQAAGSSGGPTP